MCAHVCVCLSPARTVQQLLLPLCRVFPTVSEGDWELGENPSCEKGVEIFGGTKSYAAISDNHKERERNQLR